MVSLQRCRPWEKGHFKQLLQLHTEHRCWLHLCCFFNLRLVQLSTAGIIHVFDGDLM